MEQGKEDIITEQDQVKVTYFVGVAYFAVLCFSLGALPQVVPLLFVGGLILAFARRIPHFFSLKQQYFLCDFCYFCNVTIAIYVVFFPSNATFFSLCFALSEGPLSLGLFMWPNSLVFSSHSKLTTTFIHSVPSAVTAVIRWCDLSSSPPSSISSFLPASWPSLSHLNDLSHQPRAIALSLFLLPMAAHCIWQVLHILVVEVACARHLASDPEAMTSFRWLYRLHARRDSLALRINGMLGEGNRYAMFTVIQFVLTVVSLVIAYPMFSYFYLHMTYLLVKMALITWNGAKREARAYTAAQMYYKSSLHSCLSFDEDAKPIDHLLTLPLSASITT